MDLEKNTYWEDKDNNYHHFWRQILQEIKFIFLYEFIWANEMNHYQVC